MAPIDKLDTAVWPVLWQTSIPSITHEFMYKVLWKKLCEELPNGADAACGMQGRGNTGSARHRRGRWVADDPIIALTNPTGMCVCGGDYIDFGH